MALSTAIVIDQWELFRFGIARVLEDQDLQVTGSSARGAEALRLAREGAIDLLIVGRINDLKYERLLRETKSLDNPPKVVFLVEQADAKEVARLLSSGVDGLLLRTIKVDELSDALFRIVEGERVVAPAIASGTFGTVGPVLGLSEDAAAERSGLSPKELEVLAVLAEGATYEEIANALIVSRATVKTHLVHIYSKLEVKNREQAVARALALGLLG